MGSTRSETRSETGSETRPGERPERIAILGRGRVGRGLAAALEAGLPEGSEVRLLAGRDLSPGSLERIRALEEAEVALLAVPDPAIGDLSRRICGRMRSGATILHCAGRRGPEAIELGGRDDLEAGVLHPLVSFADPDRPPPLLGTSFVIAGSARAQEVATQIAEALGAVAVCAPVHGPAYHAAAVLSANAGAALADVASRVMQKSGLPRREAERALAGLLRTVAENIERIGLPAALTGPVVRGDARAVLAHREALAAVDPAAAEAYGALGPVILDCALAAGLSPSQAEGIRAALAAPLGLEAKGPEGGEGPR